MSRSTLHSERHTHRDTVKEIVPATANENRRALADSCGVGKISKANEEFPRFHVIKVGHVFLRQTWGGTHGIAIYLSTKPGTDILTNRHIYIYSTCRWHGSCRTYPKNANSHVICQVKLGEGWPESEKNALQAALSMVVVKNSRWMNGEFYMSYGGESCKITHRRFHTETLSQTRLHTETFTHRRFYTQTLLHADAFTHRRFYTQLLLHWHTFTHKRFYTQTLLHTEDFTRRCFYTHTHTLIHRGFYTQKLLKSVSIWHFMVLNSNCSVFDIKHMMASSSVANVCRHFTSEVLSHVSFTASWYRSFLGHLCGIFHNKMK